jgi:hypothetical protein
MKEIFVRMVLGGSLVSAFAALGDVFKPKRFAGLFGARSGGRMIKVTKRVFGR